MVLRVQEFHTVRVVFDGSVRDSQFTAALGIRMENRCVWGGSGEAKQLAYRNHMLFISGPSTSITLSKLVFKCHTS